MDFLNPAKKRAHRIRLIIGYILIALGIGLVTLILVFQSYGYDLDRKTGTIIQNGLLFVAAQPEPANVFLNGKQYATQSDTRLVLPSDIYQLELKRDGYRDWKRTFSLAGGTIDRFVYPFLFPEELDTQNRKTYDAAPTFATQSPDRRWIMVQQPAQLATFDVFDANDPEADVQTIVLPADLLTVSDTHALKPVEWSTDNRHVLVQHNFTGGHEFIVIDREQPEQSFNVNRTLGRNPTRVSLRDKKFDRFYLFDQAAQTLAYATKDVPTPQPVLSGVLDYKTHGDDMVLYATQAGASENKTRIMLKEGDQEYFVRQVDNSPSYLLALARYDGKWLVTAGATAEGRAYVYQDPLVAAKNTPAETPIPISVLRTDNPNWMEFSANTQFIAMQGGQQFAVYDAENDQTYRYELDEPVEALAPKASWMDGHRLIVTSQGKMVVFDYDGINVQTLGANQPGMTPFFNQNYERLYNVAPAVDLPGQHALTLTDLLLSD